VGYKVETTGDFAVGNSVRILRPPENSPVSIAATSGLDTIGSNVSLDYDQEIDWAVDQVRRFLAGGLRAEDILIISLDDRASRQTFRKLSAKLALAGVHSNNIIADPYNEPAFTIDGHVTLSTVYRAKGNEAVVVIALGVNAVSLKLRSGRNKLFTAFTRTKAWLRISGVGDQARAIMAELQVAMQHYPYLDFSMPDLAEVNTIQRDLSKRSVKAKSIRDEYVRKLRDAGIAEEEAGELLALETDYDEE
jgi:superfamily I DNA and RNA helicase